MSWTLRKERVKIWIRTFSSPWKDGSSSSTVGPLAGLGKRTGVETGDGAAVGVRVRVGMGVGDRVGEKVWVAVG